MKTIFKMLFLSLIFQWNIMYSDYFITDITNHHVYVLDPTAEATIAEVDDVPGSFNTPRSGAWDHKTSFFVPNQGNNSISVINTETLQVTNVIHQSGTDIVSPSNIVITPDGKTGYVNNNGGTYGVSILDVENQRISGSIPGLTAAKFYYQGKGAISPDGKYYVALGFNNAKTQATVATIDVNTNRVIGEYSTTTGSDDGKVVIREDSVIAAVIMNRSDLKYEFVLNPTRLTLAASNRIFPGGASPKGIAYIPGGSPTRFLVSWNVNQIFYADPTLRGRQISPPMGCIDIGDITVTGDGKKAFFLYAVPSGGIVGIIQDVAAGDTFSIPANNNLGASLGTLKDIDIFGVVGGGGGQPIVSEFLNTIKLKAAKDSFFNETNQTVILSWTSFAEETYQIFRDSELIGTFSGIGPMKFTDNNLERKKTYTYSIVSIDPDGNQVVHSKESIQIK